MHRCGGLRFVVFAMALTALGAGATEFRVVAKEDYPLYTEPRASSQVTNIILKKDTEAYVEGVSVGGSWLKLLTGDGEEGWIPAARVQVYRLLPGEYDRYEELVDVKRRVTSRWDLGLAATYGSDSLGAGVQGTAMINVFRNGVLGSKSDQVQLGFGAGYHLGSAAAGKAFTEFPFFASWLFRLGPRGALMLGPSVGAALLADPTVTGGSAVPLLGRIEARYYVGESLGILFEATQFFGAGLTRNYFMGAFGLSFRL